MTVLLVEYSGFEFNLPGSKSPTTSVEESAIQTVATYEKTATEESTRRTLKNQIIIRFMANLGVPKFSKRARRIPVAVR
jgi:hypothetical protein